METNSYSSVPLNPATVETALKRTSFARRHKGWLIALMSVLLLLFSLTMAFHAYVAWTLARPHIDPLRSNPALAFGAPYEDVRFPSLNELSELSGWYIPASGAAPSKQTVVFSHGYGGNREEIWVPIYDLAKAVYHQGYNVLMFDYGYVQPNWNVTGGLRESQELLGAVKYAKDRGAERVYVWGFSMGAGTALQAALQTRDIDGMILDSTFVLEPDTLYHNMKQEANLPKVSQSLVHMFFPLINGVSMNQMPYSKVKETQYDIPIFFIHGKKDLKAPYETAQEIYQRQKADSGSQLWLLENDGHELIYRAHKEDYLQITTGFLRTLSSAPPAPVKFSHSR
ncbi:MULTISPECIES: alpha/beta hydrolase [Paenibacillus]|uniref:Alpha/beta hydrolase n=1 Tax=Paenibacillus naphthalenovorans TaxID=162209 RepID=A0A0U2UD80_9BACL|nr:MULTISPECIES: alpha/beta fold hydrolase [Paenibacillus]ALS24217.1 alpha/beta hydrolase [Paenibacillus naphthalenovorans]GCL73893.1 alpha/beta hydrolase [Paenibacillus naphthalenovorans]SDI50367.1 Serine aminopeptidase, S33 [Paenibacillus naphthalenovorans]